MRETSKHPALWKLYVKDLCVCLFSFNYCVFLGLGVELNTKADGVRRITLWTAERAGTYLSLRWKKKNCKLITLGLSFEFALNSGGTLSVVGFIFAMVHIKKFQQFSIFLYLSSIGSTDKFGWTSFVTWRLEKVRQPFSVLRCEAGTRRDNQKSETGTRAEMKGQDRGWAVTDLSASPGVEEASENLFSPVCLAPLPGLCTPEMLVAVALMMRQKGFHHLLWPLSWRGWFDHL